jgi:para-nitrobenzyl esterase
MASPLSQGLFQRAIGESGAFFSTTLPLKPRVETEADGVKFAESLGAASIQALRAKPAEDLMLAAQRHGAFRFPANIDGHFFPQDAYQIYGSGKQSHVPLLAGWNQDEGGYRSIFGGQKPTAENFAAFARKTFGAKAEAFLKLYLAETDEQARRSAQDLAGDQFIAFSTWKWLELHSATGKSPEYRYQFDDALPQPAGSAAESRGAYHSAEIEFVFQALASKDLPWRPEDWKLSDLMSSYWANFAKTGDPNGPGLPEWKPYSAATNYGVMHLSASPDFKPDDHRACYEFLDGVYVHK